jgi:hypothetical protein
MLNPLRMGGAPAAGDHVVVTAAQVFSLGAAGQLPPS